MSINIGSKRGALSFKENGKDLNKDGAGTSFGSLPKTLLRSSDNDELNFSQSEFLTALDPEENLPGVGSVTKRSANNLAKSARSNLRGGPTQAQIEFEREQKRKLEDQLAEL